jgi:uncharacterized protein
MVSLGMLTPPLLVREALEQRIHTALGRSPAVVLSGPRQSGKTTLARRFLPASDPHYFDLEHPQHRDRLSEPMTALEPLRGLVVIDEVQRAPELFAVLRVLIDRGPGHAQFLLLGSASPQLLRQTSESLLGRVEVLDIEGFDLSEVAPSDQDRLWLRGGYPRAFLSASDANSLVWHQQAMQRHVAQDLPEMGLQLPAPALLRFWRMLAHQHGQLWSASDPARSLGLSEPTVRRYLDTLTQTFMVRQLQPWHESLNKRQVKSPKVYLRDSGQLHALLGIGSLPELWAHPRSGASWEGFAIEQVLRIARPDEAYFWATHNGAELDLLLLRNGQRIGVEFKRADSPKLTPSMRTALSDLGLDRLYVVHPGTQRYSLNDHVEVVPLTALMG